MGRSICIGGIIALALAMSTKGSESLPEMIEFFESVSAETFEQGRLAKIVQYGLMLLRIRDSVFRAEGLRQGLQDYFTPKDTALFAPALHTHLMSSGTRVAVTAAKDLGGKTDCLITSYNHPSSSDEADCKSSTYVLEREEDVDKDMKIWEAGMATSAAPYYLPPFKKPESETTYIDGAVWANCPAQVAYAEMEKLWPTSGTAPLDYMVSLGTGIQDAKSVEMPSLVNTRLLVTFRTIFQRQLDSKSTWSHFVSETAPPHIRPRLHRFNPPLEVAAGDEQVKLYNYKLISELRGRVDEWTSTTAKEDVALVANELIASLFFFEPDNSNRVSDNRVDSLLSDKRNVDVLHGSIRCRLGHQTPQLLQLLEMVEGFAFAQLDGAVCGSVNVVEAARRLPAGLWEPVRMMIRDGANFREVPPINMIQVVDETVGGHAAVPKFRVPYSFSVRRGSTGPLVLGVKLHRCKSRIAISGFPATMADLKRRASEVWLQ